MPMYGERSAAAITVAVAMVIRWRAALPWRRALRQTGWGWGQPDYGDGYYGPYGWGGRVPGGYYGVYPYPYVTGRPTLLPHYYSWYDDSVD